MKEGIVERSDGDQLMAIYQAFDIDGELRRPLTASEMVLVFCLAKEISKGRVRTVDSDREIVVSLEEWKEMRRKRK
jgi:hypothetical protein